MSDPIIDRHESGCSARFLAPCDCGFQASRAKCLYPRCPGLATFRGLCKGHHYIAAKMIRKATATETNLIERGLLFPKLQGGRPRGSRPRCEGSLFDRNRTEMGAASFPADEFGDFDESEDFNPSEEQP